METLGQTLAGNFVIVNLGASNDADYQLPNDILKCITFIGLDACSPSASKGNYFAKHEINTVVAGSKETRPFRRNKYSGSSSLLEPRKDLIKMYGLDDYFEVESYGDAQCDTLLNALGSVGLDSVDFLKTDLEGVDFEVIKSLGSRIDGILGVQCELRFQPFFIGEPYFHQVCAYMYEHGLQLHWMSQQNWKPKTRRRLHHRDGRVVWADCIFLREPEGLKPLEVAKEIVIASMLKKRGYAEYLLETCRDKLPTEWIASLEPLTTPLPGTMRDTPILGTLKYIKKKLISLRVLQPSLPHIAEE